VKVSESIIEEWISNHGWLRYFPISAKTDVNAITDLFIFLVDVALGKQTAINLPVNPETEHKQNQNSEVAWVTCEDAAEGEVEKKGCCFLC
jgi:hypothetical protein